MPRSYIEGPRRLPALRRPVPANPFRPRRARSAARHADVVDGSGFPSSRTNRVAAGETIEPEPKVAPRPRKTARATITDDAGLGDNAGGDHRPAHRLGPPEGLTPTTPQWFRVDASAIPELPLTAPRIPTTPEDQSQQRFMRSCPTKSESRFSPSPPEKHSRRGHSAQGRQLEPPAWSVDARAGYHDIRPTRQ